MDDAKVGEIGKGFLTAGGSLKTKEQLEQEAAQETSQADHKATAAVSSEVSKKTIKSALNAVKNSFLAEANRTIENLNRNTDNLKAAKEIVREQLRLARDLKGALKSEDSAAANEIKTKLQES